MLTFLASDQFLCLQQEVFLLRLDLLKLNDMLFPLFEPVCIAFISFFCACVLSQLYFEIVLKGDSSICQVIILSLQFCVLFLHLIQILQEGLLLMSQMFVFPNQAFILNLVLLQNFTVHLRLLKPVVLLR